MHPAARVERRIAASPAPKIKRPTPWSDIERALLDEGHTLVKAYDYGEAGEKVRFKPKTFRWRHRVGGKWSNGKRQGTRCPPYGLARLLEHADETVFIVEGEKDADRLNDVGLVAVAIEQGHEAEAAEHLAGRVVFIIPDYDEVGSKRAQLVLEATRGVAASACIVELPDLSPKGDVSDWLDAGHTAAELIKLTGEVAAAEVNDAIAGFTWSDDAMMSKAARFLIDKVLPSEGVGFLYGPSYSGKSFAAHDIGMAIARGVPLAGKHKAEQGLVIFIALEAERSAKDRHVAHRQANGINGAQFAFLTYPLELNNEKSVVGLVEILQKIAAKEGAIKLVIIDTLAWAIPGLDENSSKDMGIALKAMRCLKEATGGCVMAVHHTGKNGQNGMRGSSAIFGGADFVLQVDVPNKDGPRELHVRKLKDGTECHVGDYQIVQHTIGRDENKEDIVAAVTSWVRDARANSTPRLAPKQRAIVEHLRQIILESRFVVTREAEGIPNGRQAVAENDLIERCIKGGDVTTSEQQKVARQAIRNQLIQLQQKNIIGRFDGKVWLIKNVSAPAT